MQKNQQSTKPETNRDSIVVHMATIYCEGTGTGHPRVYLKIDPHTKTTTCPYCDVLFQYEGNDLGGH